MPLASIHENIKCASKNGITEHSLFLREISFGNFARFEKPQKALRVLVLYSEENAKSLRAEAEGDPSADSVGMVTLFVAGVGSS